jgi:hypothetical protein
VVVSTKIEDLARSWHRTSGDDLEAYLVLADVDDDIRAAAFAGRKFACAHLGVATPKLGFYRAEGFEEKQYRDQYNCHNKGGKNGSFFIPGLTGADWVGFKGVPQIGISDQPSHSIGVRVEDDTTPWVAAEVAAHEVRHLAQPSPLTHNDGDRETWEADAHAYGEWVADVLVHAGKVAGVHLHDGFPYSGVTLAGVADYGDVVVGIDGTKAWIHRNTGPKTRPEWMQHHVSCPCPVLLGAVA